MSYCDAMGKPLDRSLVDCAKHALGIIHEQPQLPDKLQKVDWIKTVKIVAAAHPDACQHGIEVAIPKYKDYKLTNQNAM